MAASYLEKNKQTLRRWDKQGKLKSVRGENGYRYYDFGELTRLTNPYAKARPFLKWAGGKTQLLPELLTRVPKTFHIYLEPFLGGGALFFALNPKTAILNDSNRELIETYRAVQTQPESLIERLNDHASKHSEAYFYEVRAQVVNPTDTIAIAARLIYLNKTCYNGLYRVNQKGQFNVPFGGYANPTICDQENIRLCSNVLQGVKLTSLDYREFFSRYGNDGDFTYLDPPYIPRSRYSDFDRYSKDKFGIGEQIELANTYKDLVCRGVHAVLSNSSTTLSEKLYRNFKSNTVRANRAINKKGELRGKIDEIIVLPHITMNTWFPSSRFMGSKTKLLPHILGILDKLSISTIFDAFCGSGVVSYGLKEAGYKVIANDFLRFSYSISKALIENSHTRLNGGDINRILKRNSNSDTFIQNTFRGLYFTDEDNEFLDNSIANVQNLEDEYKKSISLAALSRACLKKRPRGLFTYTGFRYDDGRKDLSYSLKEHFLFSVAEYNNAVFDNGISDHQALNKDTLDLDPVKADLIYIDPPYYSRHSDNDYVRRYHFIEGLCRNWEGVDIQYESKTKKFLKYPSPFDTKEGTFTALAEIFRRYQNAKLLVSYSSNGLPSKQEIIALLEAEGKTVEVTEIDYRYSSGTQYHKVGNNNNVAQEYLFLAQ